MNRKIKIYLASPYSVGDKKENVNEQVRMANNIIDVGFIPFTPLLSHYLDEYQNRTWQEWLDIDLEWLLTCDCLLRFGGESKGADIEVEFARTNNIPVFYNVYELIVHFDKKR